MTKVANTISKTIGIIIKLKYQIPQTTLLAIYNSFILPYLDYCLLAWGHDSKRIDKLQRRALSNNRQKSFFSHTDPIFKKLNVLKIYDLHYVKQLKFYFKYTNNCLLVYFQNFTFQTGLKIHNYNTGGCTNLRNSIVKHEFSRECIRYQLPIVINNTPLIISNKATTHSMTGSTEYIKKICISKNNTVCNINHCYICNMLNQN